MSRLIVTAKDVEILSAEYQFQVAVAMLRDQAITPVLEFSLSQEKFQLIWNMLLGMPYFDEELCSDSWHWKYDWVSQWSSSSLECGSECEGCPEVKSLPEATRTMHYLLAALQWLDRELHPRLTHKTICETVMSLDDSQA